MCMEIRFYVPIDSRRQISYLKLSFHKVHLNCHPHCLSYLFTLSSTLRKTVATSK